MKATVHEHMFLCTCFYILGQNRSFIAGLAFDMVCYKVKANNGGLLRVSAAREEMAAVAAEGVGYE
ncbi:MAG: hypothetical protein KGQ79_08445 [Proteobacteria bacterium]|nr:hypothetical protein [Pseudomonadota bacterium]